MKQISTNSTVNLHVPKQRLLTDASGSEKHVNSGLKPSDKQQLQDFIEHINKGMHRMVGYPMAIDFDYRETYPLFAHLLNNIGDPYVDPTHIAHSKAMEREVVEFYADLFHAPTSNRWGYVTSGGTEGNLYALYTARERLPNGITYYSAAAHYSIEKALHMLRMPSAKIATQPSGEIDYAKLGAAIGKHAGKPAIVVANIGTTMTEAKDDLGKIGDQLDSHNVPSRYIHSDAALAGIYTALLQPDHPFDFAAGADSISISGHKFIGSPLPCGIVITKRSHHDALNRIIEYTGSPDTTISGSRDGHTAVLMWYAIKRWGLTGFRKRAQESLEIADHIEDRLRSIGWPVHRNPGALTISLDSPPKHISQKWQLASEDGRSHIICSPGVARQQLAGLVADLTAVIAAA